MELEIAGPVKHPGSFAKETHNLRFTGPCCKKKLRISHLLMQERGIVFHIVIFDSEERISRCCSVLQCVADDIKHSKGFCQRDSKFCI